MTNTTNIKATIEQDTAALTSALEQFHQTEDVSALQSVYRDIHSSRRGQVQSAALRSAGLSAETMMAALEAFTNLPAATSSRVNARTLTDDERTAIVDRIIDALGGMDVDTDSFLANVQTSAVERITRYVSNLNLGNARTTHNDEPTDIVPVGAIIEGTYKGNTATGTLNADNSVTVGDETFDSLSAAARSVVGRSQNGWSFWRHEGTTLAALRDAS